MLGRFHLGLKGIKSKYIAYLILIYSEILQDLIQDSSITKGIKYFIRNTSNVVNNW